METVTDFIFLGSKITIDSDCSHEIKRHLLFGRKAMINLDSILKSRDITLLINVCMVKAMVFSPVVMYRCKSWTIKKAEHWIIDAFKLWCGEDSLESLEQQGDQTSQSQRKSTLNIHWKDWCQSWSSNTWVTWCEELTHWKIPWCWERWRAGGDGLMASPTQWTWVWANSGRRWRTGKPGMLQSTGWRRVGHDWATEQFIIWTFVKCTIQWY